MKKTRSNRRKNNANPTKIGVIFIVSALALAGIGVGYSAWTDTITITGTVSTGSVDWALVWVSGTWVYKVPDAQNEIVIQHQGGLQPGERPTPPTDFIPRNATENCMAYGEAYDFIDDTLYIKWDNLFPSVYFYIDFLWHYTGSIPVKISDIEFIPDPGSDPEIEDIYDGAIMVRADVNGDPIGADGNPINPNLDPIEVIIGYPDHIQIVDECTQLHYCDYVYGVASLCVPQEDIYMGLNGAGTLTIDLTQWNEVDCGGQPCDLSKTYTFDADFDEGTMVNVNHDIVHDQLQLNEGEQVILPFIWIPNLDGTVSKVDTDTGDELGRYRVAPHSNCLPSRTTVDLQGSCWVGNRQAGTVVKIGLYEADIWIDRNGDGICQTSQDNNPPDGDITGVEILPWGQDECVLYEVSFVPGWIGTYVPGTYPGTYDFGYWGVSPRGLAIDASNNLWAGTWSTQKYYYIDGTTGAILRTEDVSGVGHHAYGAVIDSNGILWSSSGSTNGHVLRMDPSTNPAGLSTIPMGHYTYGIGLDYAGHLFVTGWTSSKLSRIDITTGLKEWTKTGPYQARGIVCTSDNIVWIAGTNGDSVYRYDNNGIPLSPASIPSGDGPTGVAVDNNGKVWACHLYGTDATIVRIDPTSNTVDLTKPLLGTNGHYSYSDMTGIISQTITTRTGTWEVEYNAGVTADFSMVTWTESVPTGTSITVEVTSSPDGITWSGWETATNGGALSVPNGQYLKVKVTFQITDGDVSPILYDLTIHATCSS